MPISNALVSVVSGVSSKGNKYYRLVTTVDGKYEFSMFLNADQVSILRLLGYIEDQYAAQKYESGLSGSVEV